MSIRIAIAGGGLVGASLALALAEGGALQRGWHITLIEPFAPGDSFQPSYDARSSALSWGARLLFEQLNFWSLLAPRVEPITDIHVSEQGHLAATHLSAAEESVPALGYVVENAWLGHCLWQRLKAYPAIEWRCPARVTAAQPQVGGYQLTLNDGEMLACDVLILADGGRSDLRQQLGIHVRSTPYGQTAIIANVSTTLPHNGQAFERFTPNGPMAFLPLSEQRCALVWTRPHEDAQRLLALDSKDFLAELQHTFGYRLGRLTQVGERHSYPLVLHEASEQVRSNLVVLGNAAHGLHPVAGQGFNLSLRDVMALSHTLLNSENPTHFSTLQRYVARQAADQQLTIGFSDKVTRVFSNANRWLGHGRRLGLLAMELCPPARHAFARQAMGLGTRP